MRRPLCSSRNVFAHYCCVADTQGNGVPAHAQTFFSGTGLLTRATPACSFGAPLPASANRRAPMPDQAEFAAVFDDLRAILADYAPKLRSSTTSPDYYYLDTHTLGQEQEANHVRGGAHRKSYVSYYFMPVYADAIKGYVACTEKAHARQSVLQLHEA